MADVITGALAITGAAFVLLASFGVLRLGDLYSRMHAATKASTLGMILVTIAGAVRLDDGRSKLTLAAVIIFVTAPVASHLVGRAAYRAGDVDVRLDAEDELAVIADDTDQGGDGAR